MENNQQPTQKFINKSRGHKTKGNKYKDRYVDKPCPECEYERAYKDEWHTKIAYTCLRRSCRHKWYEDKFPKKED